MDWNPLGAWNGMRIDEAVARRNPPRPYRPKRPLTEAGRGLKEAGSRDPVGRAQVAELVDALASGASGLTAVKVRVLSWAPSGCSTRLLRARLCGVWRNSHSEREPETRAPPCLPSWRAVLYTRANPGSGERAEAGEREHISAPGRSAR